MPLGRPREGWRRLLTLPGRMTAMEREVHRLQHLTAERLRQRVRESGVLPNLRDAEFSVHSQFGEDGIIQYLIARTAITDAERSFVEIGVEDYHEANTRYLLEREDWRGLIVDSEQRHLDRLTGSRLLWQHDLSVACRMIDRDNVNGVLREHHFEGPIGLLSIDIDGNDYWVWEAVDSVQPVIVVVEFNSRFGPDAPVSVPYDPEFHFGRTHHSHLYWGASLSAFCHLASRSGYAFVGTNRQGINAFFVREERLGGMTALTAAEGFVSSRVRQGRDPEGRLTYASAAEDVAVIRDLPLVDVTTGATVTLATAQPR